MPNILNREDQKEKFDQIIEAKRVIIQALRGKNKEIQFTSDIVFSALINLTIEFYVQMGIIKKVTLEEIREFLFKFFKDTPEIRQQIKWSYIQLLVN